MLFHICVFSASAITTKSFVEAHVRRISLFKWSKEWLLLHRHLLLLELLVGSVGHKRRIKSAVLSDGLAKGLSFVKNFRVKSSVIVSLGVILAFVGVFFVAYFLQSAKRIRCLFVVESANAIHKGCHHHGTFWLLALLVIKF